jgi:hypothetical protein
MHSLRPAIPERGGSRAGHEIPTGGNRKKRARPDSKTACDKAAPDPAVMLHLRARYVSKAAILTIPVQLVPVENRSPA